MITYTSTNALKNMYHCICSMFGDKYISNIPYKPDDKIYAIDMDNFACIARRFDLLLEFYDNVTELPSLTDWHYQALLLYIYTFGQKFKLTKYQLIDEERIKHIKSIIDDITFGSNNISFYPVLFQLMVACGAVSTNDPNYYSYGMMVYSNILPKLPTKYHMTIKHFF